jgi:hypothetical protein
MSMAVGTSMVLTGHRCSNKAHVVSCARRKPKLDEFAVTGYYEKIPGLLKEKYGDMLDEVLIYFGEPKKGNPETWSRLVRAFNESES